MIFLNKVWGAAGCRNGDRCVESHPLHITVQAAKEAFISHAMTSPAVQLFLKVPPLRHKFFNPCTADFMPISDIPPPLTSMSPCLTNYSLLLFLSPLVYFLTKSVLSHLFSKSALVCPPVFPSLPFSSLLLPALVMSLVAWAPICLSPATAVFDWAASHFGPGRRLVRSISVDSLRRSRGSWRSCSSSSCRSRLYCW